MSVLPAQTIRKLMPVSPFRERAVEQISGMSFGLTCAGYDIRIREKIIMWPGRFVLASSMETFSMPLDVQAVVHDKSSWVRRGLTVHNTVIEPGWSGYLTLELKLNGFRFVTLMPGMPIAQVVFHRLEEPTELPYTGKYQGQGPFPQDYIAEGRPAR